jgi:hypothetical protein
VIDDLLRRYKLQILGMGKERCNGNGHKRILTEEKLVNSRVECGYLGGVDIILSKTALNSLLDMEANK